MPDKSILLLSQVAKGFKDLNKKVFFLGGSTLSLYVSEHASAQNHTIAEVDCILGSLGGNDYALWENWLIERGFEKEESIDFFRQRWLYQGVPVNILACNRESLGYTNRWFDEGIFHAETFILPNGERIRSFSPAYFVAARIEAFLNRGQGDFRTSEDFEDLMFILDNRPEIVTELCQAFYEVRAYIQRHFRRFLADPTLEEGLYYVLPFGTDEVHIAHIRSLMQSIVNYKPNLTADPHFRKAASF